MNQKTREGIIKNLSHAYQSVGKALLLFPAKSSGIVTEFQDLLSDIYSLMDEMKTAHPEPSLCSLEQCDLPKGADS